MLKKNYNIEIQKENISLILNVIGLYEKDKLSLEQIAIKEKISIHTVRQMLLDNGVELRPKK